MPEANVLYGVTGVVVLGLLAWVAIVLKTAKEPWARSLPQVATAGLREDVPLETPEENEMTSEGDPNTAEKVAEAEERAESLAEAKKDAEPAKTDAEETAVADANEKGKKSDEA